MSELRLHTMPGIKAPPPYNVIAAGADCFSISSAEHFKAIHEEALHLAKSIHEEALDAAIRTFQAYYEGVLDLIRGGLLPTGKEWLEYWLADERAEEFQGLFVACHRQQRKIHELRGDGDVHDQRVEDHGRRCREQVVGFIPMAEEQIDFAEMVLARANRIVARIVRTPVADDKRPFDSDLAAQFNWSSNLALIALNTLLVASDEESIQVTDDLIGSVVSMLREAALEANHVAREGERLRADAANDEATNDGSNETDDDEDGGVGDSDLLDAEMMISREEESHG